MTQVHFTLNRDEIQKIINDSVQDNLAKDILTTIFNQRSEYIQADEYERFITRKSQRNEKALLASMLKMYISGVLTRKVSKVVEQL